MESDVGTLIDELVYPHMFGEVADFCTHTALYTDEWLALCACEIRDRAERLARGLMEHDPDGLPFAVLSRNRVDYVTAWLVAAGGHRVLTPLNARLTVPELEHILGDSGAKILIIDGIFLEHAERLAQVLPGLRVISFDDVGTVVSSGSVVDTVPAIVARSEPAERLTPSSADSVTIMYTGGTTGRPKGVVMSQRAFVLGLYRQGIAFDHFIGRDRWLMTTPMFHASSFSGMFVAPLSRGEVFIPTAFDPDQFLADVERHGITGCIMVPTMMQMVLDCESYRPERLSTLRLLGYGGSSIPEDLMAALVRDLPGCEFRQIYGATEVGGIATLLTGEDHRAGGRFLRSAGFSMAGIRTQIQDPGGVPVAAGTVGEICISTGSLLTEYHNAPEQTAAAMRNGWFRTGDAGYQDADGRLYVVDRIKDMIITGGENVYSAEVENAISSHDEVAQVAVIGVPDEVWGEAVRAIIVRAEGSSLTEEQIIAYARERLAGFKTPKSVEFRESLPTSGANKVLKHVLREQAATNSKP